MLIDVHCHANLYLIIDDILKEASEKGVHKIIAVGMSALSQERILEMANLHEVIFPSLGIHPEEVENNPNIEDQLNSIEALIKQNGDQICAIGEIGLDHHFVKNEKLYPLQERILNRMLSIAQELRLAVNLHTKGAEKRIFEILPSHDIPNVNIHWYSGPEKYLKVGIDRGYYFSITPAVSYSPAVRKTAQLVDVNHLLLESDGPVKFRGMMGAPGMIKEVLQSIAKIKNIPSRELEAIIEENTRRIFPRLF